MIFCDTTGHHWFPAKKKSDERAQKFHTFFSYVLKSLVDLSRIDNLLNFSKAKWQL